MCLHRNLAVVEIVKFDKYFIVALLLQLFTLKAILNYSQKRE